ncbi:SDR family NAD(P)-dependent oxidoreductase [Mycolicibacterium nivoides]|uniref:SDR family NAD(P)-dependent oxidoreductase n=1 Tax=Mycolicibacterium nivoides TaxID=2487344 RepID=UPI000F5C0405|nr:SDR family oxidoreductase [Mycolicibacterium nivoides]
MDIGLRDSVAFVTGGGTGIGRCTALALAAEGAAIAVADIHIESARATVAELTAHGAEAIAVEADVSDEESVADAIATTAHELGSLDSLVLCAGVSGLYGRSIDEISTGEWDRMFDINVKGQWLPVKHALPFLRLSSKASVTIVASDSALVASPLHVPYCASKGALIMMVNAMAVDLRADGIRVNCVCPSVVNTRMPKNDIGLSDDADLGDRYPIHEPDDIARYLTFLASPAAATISGHALVADFGFVGQSSFPM